MYNKDIDTADGGLFLATTSASRVTEYGWALSLQDLVDVRFVRGKKMRNWATLLDEFSAAYQFPYYYGDNMNAFFECITDLSWIPAKQYICIVLNATNALPNDTIEEFAHLLTTLNAICLEWRDLDSSQLRLGLLPARFSVVLQDEASALEKCRGILTRTRVPFSNVELT